MTEEVEDTAAPAAANGELQLAGQAVSVPRDGREDFLFHLYRGSELLYDNRPLEAKSELEHALTLEPNDPRGRGLLAVVYFRLGLYARAIGLYEALLLEQPDEAALRLNLALCQLKAGKAQAARAELQRIVDADSDHVRAWGYLGLALERLGQVDEARHAFERAGEQDMAQRMVQRGAKPVHSFELGSVPRSAVAQGSATFEDLDAGELNLALAATSDAPVAPPRRLDTLGWGAPRTAASATWLEPPTLTDLVTDVRVPSSKGVFVLGTRLARAELDASAVGFAIRLDSLRSYSGTASPEILSQQGRAGGDGETFGGIGTPFLSMKGPGHILVGPRSSLRLLAVELQDQVVFFRRDVLLGFELSLSYENGRLPLGDGDAALVQLHGDGAVLLELPCDLIATDVRVGQLTVRKENIVGWVGRLLPRTLDVGEAPCGQRGLIAFSGEGTLLLAGK
jgi:hypothetical protein